MKSIVFLVLAACCTTSSMAQATKTELYELVKKLIPDSTGYETMGDWAVGNPKKYPVKWAADRIVMSEDTSINFYRMGTADLSIRGKSFQLNGQPAKWNIMLKGPRMGYGSFAIITTPSNTLYPKYTIDSLFGSKPFKATLLKSCDNKPVAGYYYYELKLPKKNVVYLKVSWISGNGNTAIRIDCYDNWSSYAVKLNCQ